MTEETAPPNPPAYPADQDPKHPVYGFHCDEWKTIQMPDRVAWITEEDTLSRNAHGNVYRQHGNPTNWNRYLQLGLYVFDDCVEFDKMWNHMEKDPVTVHAAIWYQFMFHVTNDLPIPDGLQSWAVDISHPFLAVHDPESMSVDTNVKCNEWFDPMELDTDKMEPPWTEVRPRGRRGRTKSPEETVDKTKAHPPTNVTRVMNPLPRMMHELPNHDPGKNPQLAARQDWNRYKHSVKPASRPPPFSSVPEDTEATQMETDNEANLPTNEDESVPDSMNTNRTAAFPKILVNDGTHRITVKWKTKNLLDYEHDKNKFNTAIQEVLLAIFSDNDGRAYRWESEDLQTSAQISSMTGPELRDYISPQVTFLKSTSQIIFGIRFAFSDNPIMWQTNQHTKQQLKAKQVDITVSNSKSTSGKIVTAGYILLKAPNTTSTHRYTQYLRSKLPHATPFFDVTRFKRTPMDQTIPHLAIQCGERHVTPVCQALLKLLTGQGTALFLPRYAFSTMTNVQVENQFLFHEKWLRSLKASPMAPLVFHLDQQRIEYCDDGSIIERSAREWAATLTYPDGTPALCDVVNGTRDKKAYFLTPAPFDLQGQKHLKQYRSRLSPPSHREARFRDSVPDLPDVIHIQTEIASNVSFLTNLLTSDKWQHLPDSTTTSQSTKSNRRKLNAAQNRSHAELRLNAWVAPPAVSGLHHSSVHPGTLPVPAHTGPNSQPNDHQDRLFNTNEEHSIASTENTTLATESQYKAMDSQYQTRLNELRSETRSKLQKLEASGNETTTRLKSLEKQFTKFDELDHKVAAVKEDLRALSKQLEESVDTQQELSRSLTKMQTNSNTQFDNLGSHVIDVVENMNTLSDAVTGMRAEVQQFLHMLSTLADRQYQSEADQRIQVQSPPSHIPSPAFHPPHTPEMPSLQYSSDTTGSSTSQSRSSEPSPSSESECTDYPSSPDDEPSLLRSPPPKRTRDGDAVTADDTFMQVDQTQPESPLAVDISFEEAEDDDEFNPASPDQLLFPTDDTCTNLADRFDQEDLSTIRSFSSLQVAAAATPRTSNTTPTMQDLLPSSNPTQHPPAPLDPQYTTDTGPAGANEP